MSQQSSTIDGLQSNLAQQTRSVDCLDTSLAMVTSVDLLQAEIVAPETYKGYPNPPIALRFPLGDVATVQPYVVSSDSWILRQLFWQLYEQQAFCGWSPTYTDTLMKYRSTDLSILNSGDVARIRSVLQVTALVYADLS